MAATRDLEKEFNPSQWSKRILNPQEFLANHVEFGRNGELTKCTLLSLTNIHFLLFRVRLKPFQIAMYFERSLWR